jgi:hypothetical protein
MAIYTNEEQITLGEDLLINTPMLWINGYLQEKLGVGLKIGVPFFPPSPNTIDDLTETWIVINDENLPYKGVKCTFDRLIRMRKSPFPHIKSEQLLYYFFATQEGVTNSMIAVTETVLRLMDREDETAEEINAWARAKGEIAGHTPKFYFHRFKVYQLQETRDIIDFGTARTYGGNKIIIDFEYHQMPELANP